MARKQFVICGLCGKRLIERLPNGLWSFSFGKPHHTNNNGAPLENITPVRIMIHGSIKMRCIRKSCRLKHPDHWNVFNYFPSLPNIDGNSVSIGKTESSGIVV